MKRLKRLGKGKKATADLSPYEGTRSNEVVGNPLGQQVQARRGGPLESDRHTNGSLSMMSLQSGPHALPVKRLYIQRGPDGFGFTFSSSQQPNGMNVHFVSEVDAASAAAQSGLAKGDRIVKVNDVNAGHLAHAAVIQLLSRVHGQFPLRMAVVPAAAMAAAANGSAGPPAANGHGNHLHAGILQQQRISSSTLKSQVSQVSSIPSSPTSVANGGPTASHKPIPLSSVVVMHDPASSQFLITRRSQARGWAWPAGALAPGSSFEEVAVQATRAQTGLSPALKGILRIQQNAQGPVRLVFLAHPFGAVTMPKPQSAVGARWASVADLEALDRNKPPFTRDICGLDSAEVLKWARRVEGGFEAMPMHFIASPGASPAVPRKPLAAKAQQANATGATTAAIASNPQQPRQQQPQQQQPQQPQQQQPQQQQPPQQQARKRTSSLKAQGGGARTTERVKFSKDDPQEADTYTAAEYSRPLDPPEGVGSLRELFGRNNEAMELEQEQEIKDSFGAYRLRGCYVSRGTCATFGISCKRMDAKHPNNPGFLYSEAVMVDALLPDGGAAHDGRIKAGDRLARINGQWCQCLSHAQYLLGELDSESALDITVTRHEPLPDRPALEAMKNEDLEALAFEHAGVRLKVGPGAWTREQAMDLLGPRFDGDAPETVVAAAPAPEPEDEGARRPIVALPPPPPPETQQQQHSSPPSSPPPPPLVKRTSVALPPPPPPETQQHSSPPSSPPPPPLVKRTSSRSILKTEDSPQRKLSLTFSDQDPEEYDTYTKDEYGRIMDTPDGVRSIRVLFNRNNVALEFEQEEEIKASVAKVRLHGLYVERGDYKCFGAKVARMARDDPRYPNDFMYSEAVLVESLDPAGAFAADGRVRPDDRVVRVNGQWVQSLSHATYLLSELDREPALDVVITRHEDLPPRPNLDAVKDKDLETMSFEHAGVRLKIAPDAWTRDQAVKQLVPRFADSAPGRPALQLGGLGGGGGDDDDEEEEEEEEKEKGEAVTPKAEQPTAITATAPKSCLKREGQPPRQTGRVVVTKADPEELDTWTKSEYDRPLDPPAGCSSLRALFSRNNVQLEVEQEQEVKDSFAAVRIYGLYVQRGSLGSFGINLAAMPRDHSQFPPNFMFSEPVIVAGLSPMGAAAADGRIQVGDRIARVNGQWILCQSHLSYLLSELDKEAALDIVVTRHEPLPPPPQGLDALSDTEIETLAFDHAGVRLRIAEDSWSREQALDVLTARFADAASAAAAAASASSAAPSSSSSLSKGPGKSCLKREGQPPRQIGRVVVTDADPEELDMWTKAEYDRPLSPPPGCQSLRELFRRNSVLMENEQEKEVEQSVASVRLHGVRIVRGKHDGYGVELEKIPDQHECAPDLMYSELVRISALNDGAVKASGELQRGDRVVKINGQFILCRSHAVYVLEACANDAEMEFVVTRHEELPPAPPGLEDLDDATLETMAFHHAGTTLKIDQDAGGWSRRQVLDLLKGRFANEDEEC